MEYYVIQAFSNCEKKVKAALEERINMSGLSDKFGDIMIPTCLLYTSPSPRD